MKFVDLMHSFNRFTLFSLQDIKTMEPYFYRARLNEWQRKGYIKKIVKEYYLFSDMPLDENVLFEVANRIYAPSYISFEMALSYYHLIPESIYSITSATTRKTHAFRTSIADFIYRTIKPALFFGYKLIQYNGKYFKIAYPEKALLDHFYLNSHLKQKDDFENLRIDSEVFFEQIHEEALFNYLEKYANKALSRRVTKFWEFMKHA